MKYIIWLKEDREWKGMCLPEGRWVEQGDGPLTRKTAERIAREIRQDFGIPVRILPVGCDPLTERERAKLDSQLDGP